LISGLRPIRAEAVSGSTESREISWNLLRKIRFRLRMPATESARTIAGPVTSEPNIGTSLWSLLRGAAFTPGDCGGDMADAGWGCTIGHEGHSETVTEIVTEILI
jgi:hypothetical protein